MFEHILHRTRKNDSQIILESAPSHRNPSSIALINDLLVSFASRVLQAW